MDNIDIDGVSEAISQINVMLTQKYHTVQYSTVYSYRTRMEVICTYSVIDIDILTLLCLRGHRHMVSQSPHMNFWFLYRSRAYTCAY